MNLKDGLKSLEARLSAARYGHKPYEPSLEDLELLSRAAAELSKPDPLSHIDCRILEERMAEFVRLKVVDFEGGTTMDEIHGATSHGPSIAIVTEDGKRLVATMRNPAFAGGDDTQIRADAHRLVECWNNSLT